MNFLPKPSLSGDFTKVLENAEGMHSFVLDALPDSFTCSEETILVGGLFSLVEEHFSAIITLFRTGQHDGSAFALLRPLIEAAYRAHWIYSSVGPERIEKIRTKELSFPPLRNMAEAIEKNMPLDGLFTLIIPQTITLHGLTHGGLEQITRRFDADDNLRPNYSDVEKTEILGAATANFVVLAVAWRQLSSGKPKQDTSVSEGIVTEYLRRYTISQ